MAQGALPEAMQTGQSVFSDPGIDNPFSLLVRWPASSKMDDDNPSGWSFTLLLSRDFRLAGEGGITESKRYSLVRNHCENLLCSYTTLIPANDLERGVYRLEVEGIRATDGSEVLLSGLSGREYFVTMGDFGMLAAGLQYRVGDKLSMEYGLYQPGSNYPDFPAMLEGIYTNGFCLDEWVHLGQIELAGWQPSGGQVPTVRFVYRIDDGPEKQKPIPPSNQPKMFTQQAIPGTSGMEWQSFVLDVLSDDLLEEMGRTPGIHQLSFYFEMESGHKADRLPRMGQFNTQLTIADAPLGADCQAALLPIELLDFLVVSEDNQVFIQWISAIEINNQFYAVERSDDVLHWETLYEVSGQGNSNDFITYRYHDRYPLPGISYYRLRQMDFDGSLSFSKVRTVRIQNTDIFLYPNPVLDYLYYRIDDPDQSYDVRVFDLYGNQVFSTRIPDPSVSFHRIDLTALPPGTYLIKYVNTGNYLSRTARFVKG